MMPITVSVTGVLNLQSAAFALLFRFLASKSEAGGLDPSQYHSLSSFIVNILLQKYKRINLK